MPVTIPVVLTVTVKVPRVAVAKADTDSVDTADVVVDESMTGFKLRRAWGPPEPDTIGVSCMVSVNPLDPVRSMSDVCADPPCTIVRLEGLTVMEKSF